MGQGLNERDVLAGLTAKQCEVLDLLIQHKTSKEIARQLGISPHTVDQRIQFAKEKLGVRHRSEAAVAYRRLVEISERMTYEDSGIASAGPAMDRATGARFALRDSKQRIRNKPASVDDREAEYQVAQELFEGRNGTVFRLGAIVVVAMLLMLLVLGGLALLSQLSRLMAE